MTEFCVIINSRPLKPVFTDPDNPLALAPALVLTQKADYVNKSNEHGEACHRLVPLTVKTNASTSTDIQVPLEKGVHALAES